MIVAKFGGTSVADAERIRAVGNIVEPLLSRHPVVVVSALAGVTDLLGQAVDAAGGGDLEGLEPLLADLERRNRWAVAGGVEDAGRRHALDLQLGGMFEDLRQTLRSVRILGEVTPRARDAIMAFGEDLSSRIISAAFVDRGLDAVWVDSRQVLRTDTVHGAAKADLEAVKEAAGRVLNPLIVAGKLPVIGGFVGSNSAGETTTLGRGGSDTSAAVLGVALGAEEIQIWTDVDGLMTADPRWVPDARRIPEIAFSEAAELSLFGARVLHPASVAAAVREKIPVRVMNSMRPDGAGTVILHEVESRTDRLASVASRPEMTVVQIASRSMRQDPGVLSRFLNALDLDSEDPRLVISSGAFSTVALPGNVNVSDACCAVEIDAETRVRTGRAIVCVVGQALRHANCRAGVLGAMAELGPEIVVRGASGTGIAAVIEERRLEEVVRMLHRRFIMTTERNEQ